MGEVYAELEGIGSTSSGGYSGLREVVRAHGFGLVLGLLREGRFVGTGLKPLWQAVKAHCTDTERVFYYRELVGSGIMKRSMDVYVGKRGAAVMEFESESICEAEGVALASMFRRCEGFMPLSLIQEMMKDKRSTRQSWTIALFNLWFDRWLGESTRHSTDVVEVMAVISEAAILYLSADLAALSIYSIVQMRHVKHAERISQCIAAIGNAALLELRSSGANPDSTMMQENCTILVAMTISILRQLRPLSPSDRGPAFIQPPGLPAVMVQLLATMLALISFSPSKSRNHVDMDVEVIMGAYHSCWRVLNSLPPNEARTRFAKHYAARQICKLYQSSSDEEVSGRAIAKALRRLYDMADECCRRDAETLRQIALFTAQKIVRENGAVELRLVAHEFEMALHDRDELVSGYEDDPSTLDEGEDLIDIAHQRFRPVTSDATRQLIRAEPCPPQTPRGYQTTTPSSPDVLGYTPSAIMSDGAETNRANGESDLPLANNGETMIEPGSHQGTELESSPSSPADAIEAVEESPIIPTSPSERDELAFSAQKRNRATMVPPSPVSRRVRFNPPTPSSDDELG